MRAARHRTRTRKLRGAARGCRRRRGVHLAAEPLARRVGDSRARSRQARPVREAAHAPPRRRAPRVRRRRADGAASLRGVHVAAQPADGAARRARRGGNDRGSAARPLRVLVLAVRRGQHPPAPRRRGRLAHGRRLLLRQRLAPARRRARCRQGRGVVRPDRHRLALHRRLQLPGRRRRDVRLRDCDCRTATSSRRSAARARSSSTTRGTASLR